MEKVDARRTDRRDALSHNISCHVPQPGELINSIVIRTTFSRPYVTFMHLSNVNPFHSLLLDIKVFIVCKHDNKNHLQIMLEENLGKSE